MSNTTKPKRREPSYTMREIAEAWAHHCCFMDQWDIFQKQLRRARDKKRKVSK